MTTTPPPSSPEEPFGSSGLPSFPTSPADSSPQGSGVPRPDLTQPSSIRLAVRLMWAGAVVSVLSVIVGLITYGSFRDDVSEQLRAEDPNASQSVIDAAVAVGITFVVAVGLIGAGLWLWMAWKNGQGRAWARVVASVLAGLNVLFTVIGFIGGQSEPFTLVLSVVNLALAVAILMLLWKKESSAFYDAVSHSHTV